MRSPERDVTSVKRNRPTAEARAVFGKDGELAAERLS
jgi:hypothetical protein